LVVVLYLSIGENKKPLNQEAALLRQHLYFKAHMRRFETSNSNPHAKPTNHLEPKTASHKNKKPS